MNIFALYRCSSDIRTVHTRLLCWSGSYYKHRLCINLSWSRYKRHIGQIDIRIPTSTGAHAFASQYYLCLCIYSIKSNCLIRSALTVNRRHSLTCPAQLRSVQNEYGSSPWGWCTLKTAVLYQLLFLLSSLFKTGAAQMSPIEMHMRFTAVWALLWARQNACQLRKFCTFGMQFLGNAHRTVMQQTQSLAWQVICPIACNLAWTCRLHGLVPQMSCGTHLHYQGLIPVILFQQLYAWALNTHGTGKLQVVFRQTEPPATLNIMAFSLMLLCKGWPCSAGTE